MKIATILLAITFTVMASYARAQEPSWHLFTLSNGGTVSVIHGLTKATCEFAKNRALNQPATEEERAAEKKRADQISAAFKALAADPRCSEGVSYTSLFDNQFFPDGHCSLGARFNGSYSYTVSDGDINKAECFQ